MFKGDLFVIVERDPLGDVVTNPKRYLVSFLSGQVDDAAVDRLSKATVGEEQFAVHGRELYAWIPDGVARSKLWAAVASGRLGVAATARNWTTVTQLLAISSAT